MDRNNLKRAALGALIAARRARLAGRPRWAAENLSRAAYYRRAAR